MNIMMLLHPGTNSRGLLEDIGDGFRTLGHRVLDVELEGAWALRNALGEQYGAAAPHVTKIFLDLLQRNDIDLSVGMWGNGPNSLGIYANEDGTFTSALERHEHLHLHYWWDAPHWASSGAEHERIQRGLYRGRYQLHSVNNPATAGEMAGLMGFTNVFASPNGVNPRRFRPQPHVQKEYDLVFLSGAGDPAPTAVMLEELEKDHPDTERIRRDLATGLMPALEPHIATFDAGMQSQVRALCAALIETRLAQRHTPAAAHLQNVVRCDTKLAEAAQAFVQDFSRYIHMTDIIRRIEQWERAFTATYLSRHFKVLRLGSALDDAWPIEAAGGDFVPYHAQSEAYARGHFALNVMRWQDDVGMNSKPFEITASGVGCLQSFRTGVEEMFDPGNELIVFNRPGEARERLAEVLANPSRRDDIIEAGYQRTLRDHTWARRLEPICEATRRLVMSHGRGAVTRTAAINGAPPNLVSETGHRLAFVLSPMRSGSTLLRKMLDTHPRLGAPAESWFLLPLLSMWDGSCTSPQFNYRQASVALQSIASKDTFINAARAFASSLYTPHLPEHGAAVIDKTPMYLNLSDVLPDLFPDARFIVLTRDPRGTVWSFHTWEKIEDMPLDQRIDQIGPQLRRQYEFAQRMAGRVLHLRYEDLCTDPEAACREACRYFDVPFEPGMVQYGTRQKVAPAGYGDEKTLEHERPHDASVRRWDNADFSLDHQRRLAEACSEEALRFFGYAELADMIAVAATI